MGPSARGADGSRGSSASARRPTTRPEWTRGSDAAWQWPCGELRRIAAGVRPTHGKSAQRPPELGSRRRSISASAQASLMSS